MRPVDLALRVRGALNLPQGLPEAQREEELPTIIIDAEKFSDFTAD